MYLSIKVSILDILPRLTLDSRNYYYDEELKGYEVVVDETKLEKKLVMVYICLNYTK
jgi:hypothetical protein